MTRIMRDSTTANDIPLANLSVVLGYADGAYQWSSADWARFDADGVFAVSISTRPGSKADMMDGELGDYQPPDTPGFVHNGYRGRLTAPVVYCGRNTWPDYVNALEQAGIDPATVHWAIATLDGTTTLWYGPDRAAVPANLRVVAIQSKGSQQTGAHYDEWEIVYDVWPALATPTPHVPPPVVTPPHPSTGNTYAVQPGDTLSSIASRYNMGWHNLYTFGNNQNIVGPNPNLIYPGEVLDVPGPAPVPQVNTYIVRPGDSLSSIASKFNMSWEELYNFDGNVSVVGPNPNLIYPGQVLRVP